MNIDEVLQKLQPLRDQWQRPAWTAITEEKDGPITASKFAGTPWLAQDEAWPICGECQTALTLLLQLNLEELPAEANDYGTGLLQLFYCLECNNWEPFSKNNLARIVHPAGRVEGKSLPVDGINALPAKHIIDWKAFIDYPDPQEQETVGLQYNYDWDHKPRLVSLSAPQLQIDIQNIEDDGIAEKMGMAEDGDKLGGWPHWVQGIEYPNCPQCQRQMILVFQLDSEDNLPVMFGDVGTGHITQCPTHKEVVAFGWACS